MTRVLVLIVSACAAAPPTPSPAPVARERWCMGTRLRVVVHGSASAAEASLDEADRLDRLLSHFRPESPLSVLNRAGAGVHRVPVELGRFLRAALAAAERTDGAFDPTVGPLVTALRAGGDLAGARARVGWRRITVRDDAEVEIAEGGVGLDPGGIGKGWALDAMAGILRAAGVRRAFIDFGESSFFGLGAPPGRDAWSVLIRDERGEPRGSVVALRDASLSTSMTLPAPERPGEPARPHIADPRTGEPVAVARVAAVVSPSATDADALSTALAVAGVRGIALCDRFPGAAAWVRDAQGEATRGAFPAR